MKNLILNFGGALLFSFIFFSLVCLIPKDQKKETLTSYTQVSQKSAQISENFLDKTPTIDSLAEKQFNDLIEKMRRLPLKKDIHIFKNVYETLALKEDYFFIYFDMSEPGGDYITLKIPQGEGKVEGEAYSSGFPPVPITSEIIQKFLDAGKELLELE